MSLMTLQDLYLESLQDTFDAEKKIIEALPKMAKAATSQHLQHAFERHLEQTREHVARLERIFKNLGVEPTGKTCFAMEGLIKEGEELISEEADPDVKDAGLVAAAQRVEHYEIAGYGTLRTWAEQLGRREDSQLLQQTLDEEKQADLRLSEMAERSLNEQAVGGEP